MVRFLRSSISAFAAVVLMVSVMASAMAQAVGDFIDYRVGLTWHAEIVLVKPLESHPDFSGQPFYEDGKPYEFKNLFVDMYENRDNPVMRAKKAELVRLGKSPEPYKPNPPARHYDVYDAVARFGWAAFAQHECILDIILHDFDGSRIGETPVLKKGQLFAGRVKKPDVEGDRVIFRDLRVHEILSLQLPAAWKRGKGKGAVTLVSKKEECVIANPGSNGKSITIPSAHRRDNAGQLLVLWMVPKVQHPLPRSGQSADKAGGPLG